MSSYGAGKQGDGVWRVTWAEVSRWSCKIFGEWPKHFKDDIEGYLTFLSCSADGHVTMWTLVKKILRYSSLFEIKSPKQNDDFYKSSSQYFFGSVRSSRSHKMCLSVRPVQVFLELSIFIFLRSLSAYIVRQTEPKILRLVSFVFANISFLRY